MAVSTSFADSPAAVQPHIPTPKPGSVILVLVGSEVANDGWLPGFQRVCVLMRAVPDEGAWKDIGGIPSGLCKLLSTQRFPDISDSTEIHWHSGLWHKHSELSQRQEIPSLGPSSLQETDKGSHFC